MARKLRVEFAGACYHVINRGNYRRDLFAGEGAADAFVRCLAEAGVRFRWRVHAFVVMRNHFHLAVETPEPNLSKGMKWLQGTWAMRFNRFRGEHGRPFQGRYKALHIEPGHALAQVAHYIHLNPVRARVVGPEQILAHRWSSLKFFVAGAAPAWLEPSTILRESGGLIDSVAGWRSYLEYLAFLAEDDVSVRDRKFEQMARGWAIGSAAFKAALKEKLRGQAGGDDRFALLGGETIAHRQARGEFWEEKLRAISSELGLELKHLPVKKSAPSKLMLAAAMKAVSSVSNRWLAERLRLGAATSVASLLSRFRAAGGTNTNTFRRAISRFST